MDLMNQALIIEAGVRFETPLGIEVELKARLVDRRTTEIRLKKLGGQKVREERQIDTYFDIGSKNKALRLRSSGRRWTLTYKGPCKPDRVRAREEFESRVQDGPETVQILDRIGLHPYMEIQKYRTIYRFAGLVVGVDRVQGLGDFLEIEAKGGRTRSKILRLFSSLGIPRRDIVKETYVDLMASK